MKSEAIITLIKSVSILASCIFGAIALVKEKKNESGKMTKWGKIALSGVFLTALLSLVLQMVESDKAKRDAAAAQRKSEETSSTLNSIVNKANQTINQQKLNLDKAVKIADSMEIALKELRRETKITNGISKGMDRSLSTQGTLVEEQAIATRNILKAYYPLEPISIYYRKTFSMDSPEFEKYINRLKAIVLAYVTRLDVVPRAKKFEDLDVTNMSFPALDSTWFPDWRKGEENAYWLLSTDDTHFTFRHLDGRKLIFASLDSSNTGSYIKFPGRPIKQKISLVFDFSARLIYQNVQCENPIKAGNDELSISSIDLIGCKFSWYFMYGPERGSAKMTHVGFRFKNDYGYDGFERYIDTNPQDSFLVITPRHLGLEKIIK